MRTYTFKVNQVIEVQANSKEEAVSLLPDYPYSPRPSWEIYSQEIEETANV